jgi:hypothetical protein
MQTSKHRAIHITIGPPFPSLPSLSTVFCQPATETHLFSLPPTTRLTYSYPIYCHPADEPLPLHAFTPAVSAICAHVEQTLQHPVNHVLIQLYRTGADHISKHSDKTVDVVRGSRIVNLLLGAQRAMDEEGRRQRGRAYFSRRQRRRPGGGAAYDRAHPATSQLALRHGPRDQRALDAQRPHGQGSGRTKDPAAERAARISINFRHISTFLIPSSTTHAGQGQEKQQQQFVFGQGATGETRAEARPVVRDGEDVERLLAAFGAENHQSEFDWEKEYGNGFDVLHFAAADRRTLGPI